MRIIRDILYDTVVLLCLMPVFSSRGVAQPTHHPGWPIDLEYSGGYWTFNNVALTTLPDYGRLIAVSTNYSVQVLDLSGEMLPGWPILYTFPEQGAIEQGPRLGDLTGDGFPELVVRTHRRNIFTYSLSGEPVEELCFQVPRIDGVELRSNGSPVVVDVDQDEICELYLIADTLLLGLNGQGEPLDGFPRSTGEFQGVSLATPCIGYGENWDEGAVICWLTENFLHARTYDSDETLLGFPVEVSHDAFCSSPTLIPLPDQGWIVAFVDQDSLWAINQHGDDYPGFPVENPYIDGNSEASYDVVAADLDGDDIPELLFHPSWNTLYAFTLEGVMYPGFPVHLGASGTIGCSEPPVVLRETSSDSATIFCIDNVWQNHSRVYGNVLDRRMEYFPLIEPLDEVAFPYGQSAIFPPENGNLILIVYNPRGLLGVYDVPLSGAEFQMDWPMPGCTMGGNRLYQPQTFLNVKEDRSESLPVEFEDTIYPNPSNGGFRFQLTPDQSGQARISIYDVLGRLVFEESLSGIAGQRLDYAWSAASAGIKLAAGTYFIRLKGENTSTHRVVLLP